MPPRSSNPLKQNKWINLVFIAVCAGLLVFLYLAPEETTSSLPRDEIHAEFHQIKSKKEAEKTCTNCHNEDGEVPLLETHPAPHRCLLCHKR